MSTLVEPVRERTGPTGPAGGVGADARRPDGALKVKGAFAFSSDLWADGMIWGATVRSPHPRALIVSVDVSEALRLPGVRCVLTHEDVPGRKTYGLEVADQPVLAFDEVRYQGEPVAVVAADDPETARRAAAAVKVGYEPLAAVTDAVLARQPGCDPVHPGGNVVRHVKVRRGDPSAGADVVVSGEYEVGMQDQAFLGPESGMAIPAEDGGVDLFVATQWLHVDQSQVAAALGLPSEKVRLTLSGVGGAFGAREDLSLQIHLCLLALRTGRPVKMVYSRQESFFGHVHRHPARLRYTHGADRQGRLVFVKAEIILDGGAYMSSSRAVVGNAGTLAVGPYDVPNVSVDAWGLYTNNPPCGAMRGFGAVQACFAYESQMDKLAAAVGLNPVELRSRNAMTRGSVMPTGQVVDQPAPVAELLRRVQAAPLPAPLQLRSPGPAFGGGSGPARGGRSGPASGGTSGPAWGGGSGPAPGGASVRGPASVDARLPGGASNTTHGEGVRRGVGYAVGFKNVGYSEGYDDYSTARVTLSCAGGRPVASVHTAACEVGQGLVTVQAQVARTELGVDQVVVETADTRVGSSGSSSASRQTYMTGGAVREACREVREELFRRAAALLGIDASELSLGHEAVVLSGAGAGAGAGSGVGGGPGDSIDLADLLADGPIERTVEWRHRPTEPIDPETGQGNAHVQYSFAAHRVVVDVDVELGLVKVVEIVTAQDVGKAINPGAVRGQVYGGTAQGLGLALMEEIQVDGGRVRNPSFTDYLIPTIQDMPPMHVDILELADPHAPYGLRGVGEAPTISSTPAIVAAVRAATGVALTRVPVRPQDITGTG
ncbi:MAG TPA: molybdopterin cofactor-binding domain-containing protein [Acidimicrobiales bacterium]|nr:molybdopterin cofactor-binding domain-containing protein [Acidimicrobiales bacterium]